MTRVIVHDDPESAAAAAAELLAGRIALRLRSAGVAHVALAGGTTPRRVYERIGPLVPEWDAVHLWLGDERVVPAEHPDANVAMVRASLLRGLAPPPVLHPVQTGLGADGACDAYEAALAALVPRHASGMPQLDIALLGLGEDGHTASLFPNAPALNVTGRACVVVRDAPKPPPVRITLTLPVLGAARERIVLATGREKAMAAARAVGAPTPEVPASLLPRLHTTFVLDAAAAAFVDAGADDA